MCYIVMKGRQIAKIIYTFSMHPRKKIAKMACFNKPNQLHCIYKPYYVLTQLVKTSHLGYFLMRVCEDRVCMSNGAAMRAVNYTHTHTETENTGLYSISKNLITNMQNRLVHHLIGTKLRCALSKCTSVQNCIVNHKNTICIVPPFLCPTKYGQKVSVFCMFLVTQHKIIGQNNSEVAHFCCFLASHLKPGAICENCKFGTLCVTCTSASHHVVKCTLDATYPSNIPDCIRTPINKAVKCITN